MPRFIVVTEDPEWVEYEYVIDAEDAEAAEALEGIVIRCDRMDSDDMDGPDRIIKSVTAA